MSGIDMSEGREIEAELQAILDRPESEPNFMPRWITENLLAHLRETNDRVERLFPTSPTPNPSPTEGD